MNNFKVQFWWDGNLLSSSSEVGDIWRLLRHWSGVPVKALYFKCDGSVEVWELG